MSLFFGPTFEFDDQKQAKNFFAEILHRAPIGEALQDQDFCAIKTLLSHHPQALEKIRTGVSAIFVGKGERGSRTFFVKRNDDSIESFSMNKCIKGDHSPLEKFYRAARREVVDIIKAKRDTFVSANEDDQYRVLCPVSQQWVDELDCVVEHVGDKSFNVICRNFIQENHLPVKSLQYWKHPQKGEVLIDEELANMFREYYRKNAVIRLISKNAMKEIIEHTENHLDKAA